VTKRYYLVGLVAGLILGAVLLASGASAASPPPPDIGYGGRSVWPGTTLDYDVALDYFNKGILNPSFIPGGGANATTVNSDISAARTALNASTTEKAASIRRGWGKVSQLAKGAPLLKTLGIVWLGFTALDSGYRIGTTLDQYAGISDAIGGDVGVLPPGATGDLATIRWQYVDDSPYPASCASHSPCVLPDHSNYWRLRTGAYTEFCEPAGYCPGERPNDVGDALGGTVLGSNVAISDDYCGTSGGKCYGHIVSDDDMSAAVTVAPPVPFVAQDSQGSQSGVNPDTTIPLDTPDRAAVDTAQQTSDDPDIANYNSWQSFVVAPGDYPEGDPDAFSVPGPLPHETATAYIARLEDSGFTVHTTVDLDSTTGDTEKGPNEVVSVSPYPFTTTTPDSTTVTVYENPSDWPYSGSSSSSTDCDCPPLDFSPLLEIDYAGAFPFGVYAWVHDQLTSNGDDAPEWDIPYPADIHAPLHVSLQSDYWESNLRGPFFLVLEFIMVMGAIVYIATTMLGWERGDQSDD